jgi:hypothetical protein
MQDNFKNVLAVLKYLADQGFKVGRDKIYSDAKSGLLRVQKDKSVLAADVKLYAGTLKVIREDAGDDLAEDHKIKTRKEIEKLDLQNEKLQFELDKERGKYLQKKDFAMEVAARAVVLDTGIRHMFQVNAAEYIALVGGDMMKTNALLERMYTDFDRTMNGFATVDRFQVMVVPGTEEGDVD